MSEQLTEHFTVEEFERSDIAIRHGIDNSMNDQQKHNARLLCKHVLEPCRYVLGALFVLSGFRNDEVNKLAKGSKTSDHKEAKAGDVIPIYCKKSELFNYIKDNLEFDQLIWEFGDENEPAWVHVSYRETGNRNQVIYIGL